MEITGRSVDEYSVEGLDLVKRTTLTIAQVLGDAIERDAVIVGGLVPVLLYQDVPPVWEYGQHAGTADVDLALDLVILNKERYDDVEQRLRRSGFEPDVNDRGKPARYRWRSEKGGKIDFVMPPVPPEGSGGDLQQLTQDLAAVMMSGLDLALANPLRIPLGGRDLDDRRVERTLPVCRPEIFMVLKGLALNGRDKPKDAYDMHYVLIHDPAKPPGLGDALRVRGPNATIARALEYLDRDYREVDGRGPADVCSFIGAKNDEGLAGQALAFMREFLQAAKG